MKLIPDEEWDKILKEIEEKGMTIKEIIMTKDYSNVQETLEV